jgi:hypothetical protein
MDTEVTFASVYHPQTNRAEARVNMLIFTSINKCLEDQKKRKWAEELSKVFWRHNTSISRATNFTPFKLLFGEEAVTPEEIKFKNSRMTTGAIYNPAEAVSKDLLEMDRLKAVKKLHAYQVKMKV